MVATTDSKIFLTIRKYKQQTQINRCGVCGIKLDFDRISDYPLTCWNCMILNVDQPGDFKDHLVKKTKNRNNSTNTVEDFTEGVPKVPLTPTLFS